MRRGGGRHGPAPLGLELDIAGPGRSRRGGRDEVAKRHGRIDVLSNNAGIEIVNGPTVAETTDEEWELVFSGSTSPGSSRCVARHCRHMPEGGSIVNMASINSFVAWPNDAAYTTSKGALLQFTRALALDVASDGIRANASARA